MGKESFALLPLNIKPNPGTLQKSVSVEPSIAMSPSKSKKGEYNNGYYGC
jgi:hypothetical protein